VKDLQHEIEQWILAAASEALARPVSDAMLRPAKDASHGDYQVNVALSLAKELGKPPREIATAIAGALKRQPSCQGAFSSVEVAGPGFLNLTLSAATLDRALSRLLADDRLGVERSARPNTVVVDYSSPNMAKEMHVGHLRSTIIGDAICRVLEFSGDRVVRQNHLGDWGTQFGMLLEHLVDTGWSATANSSISDLTQLYQLAKARFDADAGFAELARKRVVALQSGQEEARALWQALIAESVRHMNSVYARLHLLLEDTDIRPESFYNPMLPGVVSDLRSAGLLVEDDGAQVVFPEGMQNKEGDPLPLFVQKSDGGYGYATTDLAAIRYRIDQLGATRVVYVVDSRQADHFKMVFWTARKAGWAPETVSLEHVPFGTILDKSKRPFKTRAGGTPRLVELLDEASERAERVLVEKSPELEPDERAAIAEAIGMGALKYADLSSERIKDYAFDTDRMLAFEGNTAPYLQNAYVRIQSIFRKAEASPDSERAVTIEHESERALGLLLLRFPRVVAQVATTLEPHRLCGYLYDVAAAFHAFYHACRVLNAETTALRESRLALCALVARTLRLGLSLLGIRVVERM
jgi:arginyl-tRNA synthetase